MTYVVIMANAVLGIDIHKINSVSNRDVVGGLFHASFLHCLHAL